MASAAYLSADATVSAHRALAVTPSDAVVFAQPTRAIYIGGTGNITVDFVDGGTAVLFVTPLIGIEHPWQVTRVYFSGTTATNIVALF